MDTGLILAVLLVVVHQGQTTSWLKDVSEHHFAEEDQVTVENLGHHLALPEGYGFLAKSSAETAKGRARMRLKQVYQGLEVLGVTLNAEVTSAGNIRGSLNGRLAVGLENDITRKCEVLEEDLRNRAYGYLGIDKDPELKKVRFFKSQPVITLQERGAVVAYAVELLILEEKLLTRPYFLMEACDPNLYVIDYFEKMSNNTYGSGSKSGGERQGGYQRSDRQSYRYKDVMMENDGKCKQLIDTSVNPSTSVSAVRGRGGNEKVGETRYGENSPFCLEPKVEGNTCIMDTEYAKVYDAEGSFLAGRLADYLVQFPCDEFVGYPRRNAFGQANDALFYTTQNCRMYKQWYGMKCLSFQPLVVVNYLPCFDNAFWTGLYAVYGTGCRFFYPLVSAGVVGHEMGHGVLDEYSDLIYRGESGGMNEAFADMAGEALKNFVFGENNWLFGLSITRSDKPLRYFEIPSQNGRSIDRYSDYRAGLGVHSSSGIFDRAMWQLVNVQKFTMRRAFEMFVFANRVLWSRNSTFQEGACDIMKAAYDLGYSVQKVLSAFAVVDINLLDCDFESVGQTIALGETRKDVLVSRFRNPVLTMDIPAGTKFVIVKVTTKQVGYRRQNVKVIITSDASGDFDITDRDAPLKFYVTDETKYLKLWAPTSEDIEVDVTLQKAGYYRRF